MTQHSLASGRLSTAARLAVSLVAGTLLCGTPASAARSGGTVSFNYSSPLTINDDSVFEGPPGPIGPDIVTPAAIGIGMGVAADPFPASLAVSGLGQYTSMTVTLRGLSHTYPGDLGIALQNPAGTAVGLMFSSGGGDALDHVDLTFADSAANSLPADDQIVAGTYRPTINVPMAPTIIAPEPPGPGVLAAFPVPVSYNLSNLGGPAGPYLGTLASFGTQSANGSWKLWVGDFMSGDGGSLDGYTLTFTTIPLNLPVTWTGSASGVWDASAVN